MPLSIIPNSALLSEGQIDFSDQTFFIRDFPSRHSIDLTYPSHYFREKDNGFYLLIGEGDLVKDFFRENPRQKFPAFVFGREIETSEIWRLVLSHHFAFFPENFLRLAEIIEKAGKLSPYDLRKFETDSDFFPLNKERLELLQWIYDKKERLKKFINTEKAGLKEYGFIRRQLEKHLEDLSETLTGMNLYGNKCRTLLEMLSDLKRKKPDSMKPVFDKLMKINAETNLTDKNDKYKKIKNFLRTEKYPEQSRIIKNKKEILKRLQIPESIKHEFDQECEKNDLNFSFSCESRTELLNFADELKRLGLSKILDDFFSE